MGIALRTSSHNSKEEPISPHTHNPPVSQRRRSVRRKKAGTRAGGRGGRRGRVRGAAARGRPQAGPAPGGEGTPADWREMRCDEVMDAIEARLPRKNSVPRPTFPFITSASRFLPGLPKISVTFHDPIYNVIIALPAPGNESGNSDT